jgi:hypothetical protein
MPHVYKIDEIEGGKFQVEVFGQGDDIPFLRQPHYPNGDTFDSYEEAETWATHFVNQDETKMYPPGGKDMEPTPFPTQEEIDALTNNNPGLQA